MPLIANRYNFYVYSHFSILLAERTELADPDWSIGEPAIVSHFIINMLYLYFFRVKIFTHNENSRNNEKERHV